MMDLENSGIGNGLMDARVDVWNSERTWRALGRIKDKGWTDGRTDGQKSVPLVLCIQTKDQACGEYK